MGLSLQEIVQKNNLLQCIQCGICTGSCPITIKAPLNIRRYMRVEWTRDLSVKHISQGANVLYFVGCTTSYDPRVQSIAKSLVKCFNVAGVDFGTLGEEENCCGSEVYHIGEMGLFEILVEENMKLFSGYGVKK
jgi:Fe-S oxidoreductase